MRHSKTIIFITLGTLLVLATSTVSYAQNNREFQLATQLLQQQKYKEALPLLTDLNNQQPEIYVYADRLIDCLIQLKEYDQALEVTDQYINDANLKSLNNIRIGEILHYKNETQEALNIWFSNLDANPKNLQLYINTARSMVDRREYLKAVEVYKKARVEFQNEQLFFGDVANAYMRSGDYELAIDEWLSMLEAAPNQITFIQRSLLRYNDPLLYDITIVELNERLDNITVSDPNYQTFFELQIWLLQENKLFRRALASAKDYESRSQSYNYALFNLGKQLVENNEFELAREAFSFYIERTYGEVKWRSLEELAITYSKWAKYIDDYNLDFSSTKDSLYQLSTTMLDSIQSETSTYSGIAKVQLMRAEIALDHIFDLDKAKLALNALNKLPGFTESPDIPYIEGRIHLANKEYSQARIAFTRANKKAEIGELAERTRYFLALTDFYSGDYEFAVIQLKSLGRQNTSYYANDALELRLWLQDGLSVDTTGKDLSMFADAIFKENNGMEDESASLFLSMVQETGYLTLKDDAMLHLVQSSYIDNHRKYSLLNSFLTGYPNTPIREKLLWEKAKLAERISGMGIEETCKTTEDCFFENSNENTISARSIYEELILLFPQGFYAPYARERLSNLTKPSS